MSRSSFRSVVALWHHRVRATADARGLIGRQDGAWKTWTWGECGQATRELSCGLISLGVLPGQSVAICCRSRPEWILADMAILAAGAVSAAVHHDLPSAEARFVVEDADATVVICENAQLAGKLAPLEGLQVILIEGSVEGALTLDALREAGRAHEAENPDDYEQRSSAVGPDDLAALVYTSGTSGQPKGVQLTHDNLVFVGESMDKLGLLTPADTHYLFLSLSHAFGRTLSLASIRGGTPTVVCGDTRQLARFLQETRPTVVAGVPRVFEAFHAGVLGEFEELGRLRRAAADRALEAGREVARLAEQGKEPRGALALRYSLADRSVFAPLRQRLGGRIKYFISGAAPLASEIAEFMSAMGLPVLEGYGLTESTAASVVNRPEEHRFGTVGKPMWGVELRLAEDGEILLRGRGIMRGYHKLPEATAEVLDEEGWLHTGDIGVLDAEGFLRITDRKKDILLLSSGHKVAPQKVENLLKARSTLVRHVVLVGDRRAWCVALIGLDAEAVASWARERGLSGKLAELSRSSELRAAVQEAVTDANSALASHENVRAFALLPRELSVAEGDLTPTRKVRRDTVLERFDGLVQDLFDD